MTKRSLILVAACAALIVVAALRWPPLEPGVVSFTRVEFSADRMVVDFRMPRPFEITLGHGIRERSERPDAVGVHVASATTLRREKVAAVSSAYDWIRGGHRVRLRLTRGVSLIVEANGRQFEVAAWSAPDAMNVVWHPPGDNGKIGDGVGIDIVQFAESAGQEEYLMLYGGTDVRRSVE